jgi:catechol 2,3-dioxygenase-like lactoylglutathione lyase family enzyme
MPGISGAVLDHVAIAVNAWAEAWPRYVVELGGEWASGGINVDFAPAQLRYANGARIEVLQPWPPDGGGFLHRFLDRHGRGPHHLTFKVPDLARALDAVDSAGLTPVSVDLADPGWKEAFLHPHQATGIVVQLAQAAGSWSSPAPEGFPDARPPERAALTHVTHAVADLQDGLALFAGLLGGVVEQVTPSAAVVRWDGPLSVRLVAPDPTEKDGGDAVAGWIGGRPGRLHHVAFVQRRTPDRDTQAGVPGLLPGERVTAVVAPEANLGTRLVLVDGS